MQILRDPGLHPCWPSSFGATVCPHFGGFALTWHENKLSSEGTTKYPKFSIFKLIAYFKIKW